MIEKSQGLEAHMLDVLRKNLKVDTKVEYDYNNHKATTITIKLVLHDENDKESMPETISETQFTI